MTIKPTRIADIVVTMGLTALVTWIVLRFAYSHLPPVPRSAIISLVVVAALALSSANSVRARLQRAPGAKPITALQVAKVAPLAKALTAAGSVIIGGWLGLLIFVAPTLDRGADRTDAVTAAFGLLPSIGVLIGGLWLERLCRAPEPPPDDENP